MPINKTLVEQGLNSYMAELADYDPNDILTDWVIVAYIANPDPEKQECRFIAGLKTAIQDMNGENDPD